MTFNINIMIIMQKYSYIFSIVFKISNRACLSAIANSCEGIRSRHIRRK